MHNKKGTDGQNFKKNLQICIDLGFFNLPAGLLRARRTRPAQLTLEK